MAAEAAFGQVGHDEVRKTEMYVRIGLEGNPESVRCVSPLKLIVKLVPILYIAIACSMVPRIRLTNTKTVNA